MKLHRFRRWLRNWLTNFDYAEPKQHSLVSLHEIHENPDSERALNLRVWFANGGKVIQITKYDRRTDDNTTSLYVITENQDLGRELEKIITMEGLRG